MAGKGITLMGAGVGTVRGAAAEVAATNRRRMCHTRDEGRRLYAARPTAATPMPARDISLALLMQCQALAWVGTTAS